MTAALFGATISFAAANDDFYEGAFRSGVAAFESGTYELAVARLRVAAFGYLQDLPRYETAQAYIAVAEQRLQHPDKAANALKRIVAAERVERHFAALDLPPALRGAVSEAAKTLLTPEQAAWLMPPGSSIAATEPTAPAKPKP